MSLQTMLTNLGVGSKPDAPEPGEPKDAMVDLETLGTDPYAPILAIGACAFNFDEAPIEDLFYQTVDVESCLELGMRASGSTLKWWMQQADAARSEAFNSPLAVGLPDALDLFTEWWNSRPLHFWGNSARFDAGLLEAAYKTCHKIVPWHWPRERDYRTIKHLPGAHSITLQRFGTHHNALDDAISQALHLRSIFRALKLDAPTL
jgi:3' exoribonuclease, RNase T-like